MTTTSPGLVTSDVTVVVVEPGAVGVVEGVPGPPVVGAVGPVSTIYKWTSNQPPISTGGLHGGSGGEQRQARNQKETSCWLMPCGFIDAHTCDNA